VRRPLHRAKANEVSGEPIRATDRNERLRYQPTAIEDIVACLPRVWYWGCSLPDEKVWAAGLNRDLLLLKQ
jgi:hypothetical protein